MLLIFFLFLTFPILGVPLALYQIFTKPKFYISRIICIVLILGYLCWVAYLYVPTVFSDLTRYLTSYIYPARYSNLLNYNMYASKRGLNFVQSIFFFLVSKIGSDKALGIITILLTYSFSLYIVCNFNKKYPIPNKSVFLSYFFLLLIVPFALVISNVRNILSVGFACIAIYRDLSLNKKNVITFIFYFLAIFMHATGIIFVLVRFIIPILNGITLDKKNFFKSLSIFLIAVFFVIFILKTQQGISLIQKAIYYLKGGNDGDAINLWFQAVDKNPIQKINKIFFTNLFILISSILSFLILKDEKICDDGILNLVRYILFFNAVTFLLTFLSGTMWNRFLFVNYFLGFIPFCYLDKVKFGKSVLKFVVLVLMIWSILWQGYQFKSQSVITLNEVINIIFPVSFILN